jgi:eukaryotic-like serine/threonine-protein kinase
MPVDRASSSSWEDEPSELPVAIGDVLDGKYKVVRVLGKGGMGVVMSAEHIELGHRIALKFLSRAGAKNEETLARFALEAKAAALMRSEHATRIWISGACQAANLIWCSNFSKAWISALW